MPPKSKSEIDISGGANGVYGSGKYLKEIENEIISLKDNGSFYFVHGDGNGNTLLIKNEAEVTAITSRYIKSLIPSRSEERITVVSYTSKGVMIEGYVFNNKKVK